MQLNKWLGICVAKAQRQGRWWGEPRTRKGLRRTRQKKKVRESEAAEGEEGELKEGQRTIKDRQEKQGHVHFVNYRRVCLDSRLLPLSSFPVHLRATWHQQPPTSPQPLHNARWHMHFNCAPLNSFVRVAQQQATETPAHSDDFFFFASLQPVLGFFLILPVRGCAAQSGGSGWVVQCGPKQRGSTKFKGGDRFTLSRVSWGQVVIMNKHISHVHRNRTVCSHKHHNITRAEGVVMCVWCLQWLIQNIFLRTAGKVWCLTVTGSIFYFS